MKPSKFFFAVLFLLACTGSWAKSHRTLNIINAYLTYDGASKNFILWGVRAGVPDAENLRDPFVRIFIETGDGNYIVDSALYDEVVDGMHAFTRKFVYSSDMPVNVTATLVKTYDKGGPRSRLLTVNQMRPSYYDINADNSHLYPQTGVSACVFDGVAVPEDTMIVAITVDPRELPYPYNPISIQLDTLLKLYSRRYSPGVTVGERQRLETYDQITIGLADIDRSTRTNIFFSLVTDTAAAHLPNNALLVLSVPGGTSGKSGVPVARSHDPNALRLVPEYNTRRASASPHSNSFHFEIDIENLGVAQERNITVGLKFLTTQFDASAINVAKPVIFGRTQPSVTLIHKWRDLFGRPEMDTSQVIIDLTGAVLEGINRLPSGHFLTRGKIIVRLPLKPGVPEDTRVSIQAIVRFGKGRQAVLTPTNEIRFSKREVQAACDYMRANCATTRACDICEAIGAMVPWLCKW